MKQPPVVAAAERLFRGRPAGGRNGRHSSRRSQRAPIRTGKCPWPCFPSDRDWTGGTISRIDYSVQKAATAGGTNNSEGRLFGH